MKLYETLQTQNASFIRARAIKPIGIFVHSTGATNPNAKRYVDAPALLGVNTYGNHWNKTTATKSVHAFIGLDINNEVVVCHTLPYNIACWGAGGGSKGSYNYNPQAHVQFEVCEDNAPRSGVSPTQAQRDYYNSAWLAVEEYCTYLCKLLNLPASSIVGHYEAAKRGYASNHSDPANWMKVFGDSMDKLRERVNKRLSGETATLNPDSDQPAIPAEPAPTEPKVDDSALVIKSIVDGHIIKMRITKPENISYLNKPFGTIVEMPIEEYLMSVVPAEVGNAHVEACKAQAIAARSIVYYWTKSGAVIDDTSAFQSFRATRGTDSNYANAHAGVKETKGQVLMYDGKIAQTYYADSNGGKMVASGEHWSQSIPYLVTKDDPWTLASGKPFNGHPVGMSQQGAIWAANHGIKYDEILAFYYPGTEIQPNKTNPLPNPEPGQHPVSDNNVLYLAEVITKNPLSLNIWETANKGVSLKRIPQGAKVEVLGEINNTWAKVRYAGVIGYSDRQYLKRQSDSSDALYTATVKTRYPLSLNIWKDAKKGTALVKIPNGDTVDVLAEVDSTWVKVRYKGTVGFSDRQYLVK